MEMAIKNVKIKKQEINKKRMAYHRYTPLEKWSGKRKTRTFSWMATSFFLL